MSRILKANKFNDRSSLRQQMSFNVNNGWMVVLAHTYAVPHTYTHLLLLTLWHWKHRNQEYYYRKWGDNDKYLLLLFKTFLYIQRLLVIMFVSYAVSLSLSASFISFTFLMGCALMKYWLEASRRLSQLLLKIDNDQLLLLSSDRYMFSALFIEYFNGISSGATNKYKRWVNLYNYHVMRLTKDWLSRLNLPSRRCCKTKNAHAMDDTFNVKNEAIDYKLLFHHFYLNQTFITQKFKNKIMKKSFLSTKNVFA